MFAIVDIETCGGRYEYRRGRIIDICILVHDGLTVVDQFSTLINPECHISTFFSNLSGITNEMVKDAPKFHEVAKKIIEMTENRIFVAHNVGFDFGFIREEFAALGYKYRREQLCTVRMSRKLQPSFLSHSLGHLCEALGIENKARHRAEGDALATAELFDHLLRLKNADPRFKNQGVESLMSRRIDKIRQYVLDKLPETCGVYYFLDKDGNIIYIGKSTNMYSRAISHFNSDQKKSKKMLNDLYNVDHVETGSELVALLHEAEEIKIHKPAHNRQRKNSEFTHCLDMFTDEQGVINFKIVTTEESENAILQFNTYATAREKMDRWIDDYQLCMSHCGLSSKGSSCFQHQIKNCNGICCGEETIEAYNKRASQAIAEYSFPHPSFILFDRGRSEDEQAIILIENNQYKGYGYIDSSCQIQTQEDFKDYISAATYYPDANDIIRQFMKTRHFKTVVLKQATEAPLAEAG